MPALEQCEDASQGAGIELLMWIPSCKTVGHDFYLAREGDANPGVPKQYIFEMETCLLKSEPSTSTFLKESRPNVAPITEGQPL